MRSETLHAGTPSAQCLLFFQMCPAIDAVLVYVNKKWANLNGEQLAITCSCVGIAGWLDFDAPLPIQVPAPSPALGLEEV